MSDLTLLKFHFGTTNQNTAYFLHFILHLFCNNTQKLGLNASERLAKHKIPKDDQGMMHLSQNVQAWGGKKGKS